MVHWVTHWMVLPDQDLHPITSCPARKRFGCAPKKPGGTDWGELPHDCRELEGPDDRILRVVHDTFYLGLHQSSSTHSVSSIGVVSGSCSCYAATSGTRLGLLFSETSSLKPKR